MQMLGNSQNSKADGSNVGCYYCSNVGCYHCSTHISTNRPKNGSNYTNNTKADGSNVGCYHCSTHISTNRPKNGSNYNYNSPKDGINGKKFPELEKESLFPQTDSAERKFISARKEHEPALTCPHGKKCHRYKHSYNKGHCETYSCKIFLEAFQSGREAGERWINQKIKIHRLSKNRKALEAFQGNMKSLLKEAAQKPKTELHFWNLGFWHGALLRLQTISPED
uniref:ORF present in extra-plastid DNA segment n=1 Tax=Lobelia montana TaxID=2010894 RepID=UPI00255209BB|nr:ORF present in extra-plastid DNA segment [Lobelia montana]WGH11184.1 ORF present in extra-plastid DNA segment [Lobelia montana]